MTGKVFQNQGDIEVPIEHSKEIMDRFDQVTGFGLNEYRLGCYQIDDKLFNIRISYRTIGQSACYKFIDDLCKEFDIEIKEIKIPDED